MGELRSEDAATRHYADGWRCNKCGRFFYGSEPAAERSARYCCAESFPCECGGRHDKGWTCCVACRAKLTHERWAKLERGEWDGVAPLARFTGDDKFFWTADELAEYLHDNELGLDDVMLVFARPDYGHKFSLSEYLDDALHEDNDLPESAAEVEDVVNKWLKAHGPFSWWGGKTVPSDESLRTVLGEGRG